MYLYAQALKGFNIESSSPSVPGIVAFPYWVGAVRRRSLARAVDRPSAPMDCGPVRMLARGHG